MPLRTSRRRFLGGVGSLGLGLLGLELGSCRAWAPTPSGSQASVGRAQIASPWEGLGTGQVREFQLAVRRAQWELAPGNVVDAYTYSGEVPGPELRVTEGDTVRVRVANELQEPTTVHWHGVEVPVGMDGVPQLSQEPVPPGGTFIYEFVATPAGTRWYHPHFNELAQHGRGLFGPLIIEPREASGPAPERDYTLVLGEWIPAASTEHQSGMAPPSSGGMGGMMGGGGMGGMMGRGGTGGMMGRGGMSSMMGSTPANTLLVNGKTYPSTRPLLVREGERVRLRLINAGATETLAVALACHRLRITHTDGNLLTRPVESEAVLLGVGERVDVEFTADNPGRWQLGGLSAGQATRGLATDVVYEGHESDAVQLPSANLRAARYGDFTGPTRAMAKDRTYDLSLSGGMMGSSIWTINGKSYPDTDPLNVRLGERVRLKLFNMSMEDHPMHLHGHTFQVVGAGGRAVDGPLKDSLLVRPMEGYEIAFYTNNPGVWLFHCHNLMHMDGGLMTELRYL
jgi:multicopper oxidase